MEADKGTLIDAQSNVEGKITGKDMLVLGRFNGEVQLSGRFVTGEGSWVHANVTAESAEIAGEFKGELHVKALTLLEKARVEGSVQAQRLAVRDGAQLNGSVTAGAVRPQPESSLAPAPPTTGVLAG